MMNLTNGLQRSAFLFPDRVATIFGERRRSWKDVHERVTRLAGAMVRRGIKPGDRVASVAVNSDRFFELYFAVAWAGAVIVPGNFRWSAPEHVYALNDSGAKLVFLDGQFTGMAGRLLEECPSLEAAVYMDDGQAPDGLLDFEQLIAQSDPTEDRCGHGSELCGLFYTGGTTGRSKGVMLSHDSLIGNYMCRNLTVPRTEEQIYIHSAPMFHLADAAAVYGLTFTGGTHVIISSFTPENFVKAVTAERCTDATLVPSMLGMLQEYLTANGGDLSSITSLVYGASAISDALVRQVMELFPNASLTQAYGQTELSPCATLLTPEHHRAALEGKPWLRSAGQPMCGMQIRIVDENMTPLPFGAVGEITVSGPGVMLGYWNQPELTAATLVDGWVRTGDAGYMDDEGFVYVVDRVKDMIISGGENVYSAEVENALSSHSAIQECAVIGVPDEKWGERVHAIVRLKSGESVTAEEISAHCKYAIAGYKCPRSIEFRKEPLPLSAQGKILKVELRKLFWQDTERNIG